MPALISEPLILQPPTDLQTRFPHAVNLARQLALKYVHHYVVTEADLQTVGGVLWQTAGRGCGAGVRPACRRHPHPAADRGKRRSAGAVAALGVSASSAARLSRPTARLYPEPSADGGRIAAGGHLSTGPLKVLLFTSMPDDLDPEKERLDVESEQAAVLEALDPLIQDGLVELTTPDDGRFTHLQALLREETFHLVFLSGHGEFREIPFQPPEAVFIFEGEDGHATPVAGADLAEAFMGSAVQAVVLSACQSGKSSSADLSASLAGQLLHAGLPQVVGMRESILDVAGTRFSQALCAALGRCERLDVALQAARRAIAQPLILSGPHRDAVKEGLAELTWGQWCLPLLYSRDPGRSLIDWNFQPVPPQPPLLRYEQLAGIPCPRPLSVGGGPCGNWAGICKAVRGNG